MKYFVLLLIGVNMAHAQVDLDDLDISGFIYARTGFQDRHYNNTSFYFDYYYVNLGVRDDLFGDSNIELAFTTNFRIQDGDAILNEDNSDIGIEFFDKENFDLAYDDDEFGISVFNGPLGQNTLAAGLILYETNAQTFDFEWTRRRPVAGFAVNSFNFVSSDSPSDHFIAPNMNGAIFTRNYANAYHSPVFEGQAGSQIFWGGVPYGRDGASAQMMQVGFSDSGFFSGSLSYGRAGKTETRLASASEIGLQLDYRDLVSFSFHKSSTDGIESEAMTVQSHLFGLDLLYGTSSRSYQNRRIHQYAARKIYGDLTFRLDLTETSPGNVVVANGNVRKDYYAADLTLNKGANSFTFRYSEEVRFNGLEQSVWLITNRHRFAPNIEWYGQFSRLNRVQTSGQVYNPYSDSFLFDLIYRL